MPKYMGNECMGVIYCNSKYMGNKCTGMVCSELKCFRKSCFKTVYFENEHSESPFWVPWESIWILCGIEMQASFSMLNRLPPNRQTIHLTRLDAQKECASGNWKAGKAVNSLETWLHRRTGWRITQIITHAHPCSPKTHLGSRERRAATLTR
jgi:hypothetical protein